MITTSRSCARERAHSSEGRNIICLYKVKVLEESLLLLPPLLNYFICCLCVTVILALCIRNYLVHHVNDHFINYYLSFVLVDASSTPTLHCPLRILNL